MKHNQEIAAALSRAATDIELRQNEPMARHTTFAIGGPADLFVTPLTAEALRASLVCLREYEVPCLLLGNGSNMLVSDEGVRGAVLCTCALDTISVDHNGCLTAESGALLSAIARRAQREALTGLEFAGGIPGSVGGAVFMNAGAYDGQMSGVVRRTEYMDGAGQTHVVSGLDHAFGYRHSIFREHEDWTVLRTVLQLENGSAADILDKMNDFAHRRRDKQPLNFPSAGSTFKRPEGHFAGQLIEQAGMKGFSVGGAQVSEKHAGFLINRGGATCEDMLRLIAAVQERVQQTAGVELECEVRLIR